MNIKSKLGLFENINYKCKNGFQIKVFRGRVYEYHNIGNPQCNECGQNNLHEHEFFYRCSNRACGCQTDICRVCALTKSEPPLLEENLVRPYLSKFPESITRHPPNHSNGWSCDGKTLEAYKDLIPGCRSNPMLLTCQMQIKQFHQTKYV